MAAGERPGRAVLAAVIAAALIFLLCASQVLYSVDKLITDPLYQIRSVPNPSIRIIAIDEKTLAEYGDLSGWSRDVYARLTALLTEEPASAPAVIAYDILFVSERDGEGDVRFAEACGSAGNVAAAANLVYRAEVTAQSGSLTVDDDHVVMAELPYEALRPFVRVGFANTQLDLDQYVRYARLSAEYDGQTIYSLPAAVYLMYCESAGLAPSLPGTDGRDMFGFQYTGGSGCYETLSLCDVLEGRIDPAVFRDCIVFVGAYAPGMQDSYSAPIQRGGQMYGVEIQANILEAIMEGRTQLPVNTMLWAVIAAVIAAAYILLIRRMKLLPAGLLGLGLIAALIAGGKLLFSAGHVVTLAEPILAVIVLYAARLVLGYILETLRKRRILNTFRKYVAPQIVEEALSHGDVEIRLGGERRHIAVLFVDIRGFTPMSEGLEPEQVVEILNDYLQLTSRAIFNNSGTLDKFIGDAAMAVFNAPLPLDDYVYRAVCTARDIAAGSAELERRLMERFGKSVSFGIGVNCGDAVVGNIGCDIRMDYTAIGDTVNTAARLESNAGRGQILISEAVYEALRGRVRVTEVGNIPLKGKSNNVFVYQLDEVL